MHRVAWQNRCSPSLEIVHKITRNLPVFGNVITTESSFLVKVGLKNVSVLEREGRFNSVINNDKHLLYKLLPPLSVASQNLRRAITISNSLIKLAI